MSPLERLLRFPPLKRALYLHCGESARLITARLDGPLPLRRRIRLAHHLVLCRACSRFVLQMRLMDSAMGRWRNYVERPENDE